MTTLAIRYAVLTDAYEDCTSLWDGVWEHAGRIEDEAEREKQYAACIEPTRRLLQEFVAKGLIVVERCSAWAGGRYTPIPPEEVPAVLAEDHYWYPSDRDEDEWICFCRTEVGNRVWHEGKEALERFLR